MNPEPRDSGSLPESIFVDNDGTELDRPPEGWKQLEPGDLPELDGGLLSFDIFASRNPDVTPTAAVPPPVESEKSPSPSSPGLPNLIHLGPVAGPILDPPPTTLPPPITLSAAAPVQPLLSDVRPPPAPAAILENPVAHPLHHAPPLLETPSGAPVEKLHQPQHLTPEGHLEPIPESKTHAPTAPTVLHKAPALLPKDPPASAPPATALPTVPPSTSLFSKFTGRVTALPKEKSALPATNPEPPKLEAKKPLASALSNAASIKVEESKPSLRPAVLPNKLLKTMEEAKPAPPVDPVVKPRPDSIAGKSTDTPLPAKPPEPTPPPKKVSAIKVPESAQPPAPAQARKKRGKWLALPTFGRSKAKTAPPLKSTPASVPPPLAEPVPPPLPEKTVKTKLPPTRAERARKRQIVGIVFFYLILLLVGAGLYWEALYFSRQTRLEGQVIPPPGMPLSSEVWLVSDFRELASGIAEDLASDRAPLQQEIQDRQDHVQRAQADVALREEKIRLLQSQIDTDKASAEDLVKQARDASQRIWDGPGADLDKQYNERLNELQNAIAARARSLKLNYVADDTYHSPEVWANAYRLALYQVPPGVDGPKEHRWLSDQLKQWRDFVKNVDTQRDALRDKAAEVKLAPAAKLGDINTRIAELQHRIENTQAEEDPIKTELQQAQTDYAQAQASDQGLDDKYYKQLDALPGENIIKRIPLQPNGRFSWIEDNDFAAGETEHHYWIFARATRADGREYWSLGRFTITKDSTRGLIIEPESFVSTKTILRPNLSPDEQAQ